MSCNLSNFGKSWGFLLILFFQPLTYSKVVGASLIQSLWSSRVWEFLVNLSYSPFILSKRVYKSIIASQKSWCTLQSTYLRSSYVKSRKEEAFEAIWESFSYWLMRAIFFSSHWFRTSAFPSCFLSCSTLFFHYITMSSCSHFNWLISCSCLCSASSKSCLDFYTSFSFSLRPKLIC